MSMTDPIADFLARIRNGIRARKQLIECPRSTIKLRLAEILRRFGELVQLSPDSIAVRCAHGDLDLAEIIRVLDAESIGIANLQLHAPSLDDVFLAKTGRSLEGAEEEEAEVEA